MRTQIKTQSQIAAMRESGRILASVLRTVAAKVVPGASTKELANLAAKELRALGGEAPFLGHISSPDIIPYPDVICLSLNDEIVHGIPSDKKIVQAGDVLSVDFGVSYRGMITDAAITVAVEKPKNEAVQALLTTTEQSLEAGIAAVHHLARVGDISAAIERTIRSKGSYGIPRELVGHGVGQYLWEEPNIPNYGQKGTGAWLSKDMTVAIEPMVTLGTSRITVDDDGWTIRTADGSWAAHFEHTVLITPDGAEILTR